MSDVTPDPPDQSVQEARLEAVLDAVTDGFYAVDTEWRVILFNRAAEEYFGVPREEVLGRTLWELFPQGVGLPFERYCRAAMEEGVSTTFETTSELRPGAVVELRILPMRGGGVAVALNDITDRRRAEDAVKAELARSESILESISDAFYAVDADWRFTYVNRVAEAWWGVPRETLVGRNLWETFPQAVDSSTHEAHLRAARERTVVRAELISPVLGRWMDVSIFPTDTGLFVYFRDIGLRKQAEARQQLLVNELNHRVKNALATVQAIAAQSLRGAHVPAEARESFTARLMALASANDVLVAENWEGARLEAVARRVASPYEGDSEPERFQISGPDVHLSPAAATAFALALHELATNAAKYGALSRPDGRVRLSWAIEDAGQGGLFKLTWSEQGGPVARPPERTGFGTRLIEKGLASELGGQVSLDYAPEGLTCRVVAPLSEAISRP